MKLKLSLLIGVLGAAACSSENVVTPDTVKPAGTDNGTGTTDNGDAGSRTDSSGGTSAGDAGTDAAPPNVPSGALAEDLTVTEVAILQGVKIDLVKGGAKVAQQNAPIVAGREALLRVYIAPASGYVARSLTAELHLEDATNKQVLKDTRTLSSASTDDAVNSTFNFNLNGDQLTTSTKFSVSVRDPAKDATKGASSGPAQYPAGGAVEALGVQSDGPVLKVVVVPVQYGADGSNRLPDIGTTQLDLYRKTMYGLYPAAKVDVTARAAFPYASPISANGSGYTRILQAIQNLRQQDNAPDDVYYYGAFAPASSFTQYCNGSCVTGVSGIGTDPQDALIRASVGIGFSGLESAITMAHEVGHAHGRAHSPCGGAASPDPHYPYAGGGIGVQGYNVTTRALVPASSGKDIMGYCQPDWISDYTYRALFDRIQFVNGAHGVFGAFPTPQQYRFVEVAEDGTLTWGQTVTLKAKPWGEVHEVTYHAPDGSVQLIADAHFYTYDHLPGGYALVPEGPESATRIEIKGVRGRTAASLYR